MYVGHGSVDAAADRRLRVRDGGEAELGPLGEDKGSNAGGCLSMGAGDGAAAAERIYSPSLCWAMSKVSVGSRERGFGCGREEKWKGCAVVSEIDHRVRR